MLRLAFVPRQTAEVHFRAAEDPLRRRSSVGHSRSCAIERLQRRNSVQVQFGTAVRDSAAAVVVAAAAGSAQ